MASKRSKQGHDLQGPGVTRLVERLALAGVLFLVPLAATTGFSRYEVFKSALLYGLGGVALTAFIVDFCRARQPRRLGGGWVLAVALLLALYSAVSLLWAGPTPEAPLGMVRWLLLLGVFALAATRTGCAMWVAGPLVAAGVLTALTMVLHRFGLAVPPAIPTGMAFDAGAHGTFDHVVYAGVFLTTVGPLSLYAASLTAGLWRRLLLAGAPCIFIAVGLAGSAFTAVALGSLVVGTALTVPKLKSAPRALEVWAAVMLSVVAAVVGQFALGPVPPEPAESTLLDLTESVYERFRLEEGDNAITAMAEWRFEWERAARLAEGARWLGHGVGTWSRLGGTMLDSEDAYYASERSEHYRHDAPPGAIAGLRVEQGIAGVLLFALLGLGILVVTVVGLRVPDPAQAAGAGFLAAAAVVALGYSLVTPAAYHVGEGVGVFAVLGLALSLHRQEAAARPWHAHVAPAAQGAFARFERWLVVGLPVLALLGAGVFYGLTDVVTDYKRQRGELYMWAREHEAAIAALAATTDFDDTDYGAHYLLGLARYYTPTDDERAAAGRDNLVRAARLRPNDVRVQLQVLRDRLQHAGQEVADRLDAVRRVRNRLIELSRFDPRETEVYVQLAHTHRLLADYEEAATTLVALTRVTTDRRLLSQAHYDIGRLYEEELDRPEAALVHYERVAGLMRPASPLARDLAERLGFVREWLRRGSRPPERDFGHGGHERGDSGGAGGQVGADGSDVEAAPQPDADAPRVLPGGRTTPEEEGGTVEGSGDAYSE